MAYHTKSGTTFVGLRHTRGRGRQIVYDALPDKRVLFDILDQSASDSAIREALREGINASNVLHGLVSALRAREIRFDYPG
jgi:hypothetical protein